MVLYACNPSTWGGLKQKDHEFKASLGYVVRPQLKRK
jgi:hypothetical protein